MSKFLKALVVGAGTCLMIGGSAAAETLGLGREATPAEVAAWDIDVRPDGAGLPEGSGDVFTGEEVFAEQCAACHGDFGEGVDRWPVLAGGQGTLDSDDPVKTIGSYWPYLSTVYDYVNRAMPFGYAQSLSPDEVYAITAYLLYANDLVDDDFELSRENFAEVRLPNEENFFMDDREDSPLFGAREVCMEDCKPAVEITKRALVLDVTPEEDGAAGEQAEASQAVQVAAATQVSAPPEPAFDAALAEAGEEVFGQCKTCHQVGENAKNRAGPILTNIMGAPVGAVEGFRYSRIFKTKAEEGVVWDVEALDAFLEKPRAWAKGTKMNFRGLDDEQDRLAVIEYLKSVSE